MKKFKGDCINDVYDHTKNLLPKEKGDFFEEFVANLITKDPHFNFDHNRDNIWLYKDIPNKIKTKLNLPKTDKGIDIIAKIDNKYISVQCKFVQNVMNTPCWKSLGTFFRLTYGVAENIDRGYLITNSYKINSVAQKSKRVSFIYGDYFNHIPSNYFENMHDDDVKIIYDKKNPLDHQSECINAVCKYYIDNDVSTIEMACGTGKTLTSYWVDKEMINKKTIIFVPSLDLLSQFYENWFEQSYSENIEINFILVGSDVEISNSIDPINGIIVTTNVDEIINNISNEIKNVVICTYQSIKKISEAKINFDFGIYDEAHRMCTLFPNKNNTGFSNALDNDYIIIRKKLFMTATPKFVIDSKLSMDNEEIYGKQVYCCNFRNAIDNGILVDYKINIMSTNEEIINQFIKKNKLIIISEDNEIIFSSRKIAIALMLLNQINNGNINHLVTYHNHVKSAKKFAILLKVLENEMKCESMSIASISGDNNSAMRKKIIGEFVDSDRSILCSTRLLTEGVNIPIIDSICFVNSKHSEIDIIQCIGRSLRKHPDKTKAKIYLPIFEQTDNKNNEKKYGNIIRILFALNKTGENIVLSNNKIVSIPIKIGQVIRYNAVDDEIDAIDIKSWFSKISPKAINKCIDLDYEVDNYSENNEDNENNEINEDNDNNNSEKSICMIKENINKILKELDKNCIEFDGEFVEVIVDNKGKIWFCAKDMLRALGYKYYNKRMNKIPQEKRIAKRDLNINSYSGRPNVVFINEITLYRLLIKAKTSKAKQFAGWVYEELLPTVRKYKVYKLNIKHKNEMTYLTKKIDKLEKLHDIYKQDRKKEKYPEGEVFYAVDYSNDYADYKTVYRIGMSTDMKSRKRVYNTHTIFNKKVAFIKVIDKPIQYEMCLRSMLYDYRITNNKDFYACSLDKIKKSFIVCDNAIKEINNKKNGQKGGRKKLYSSIIKKKIKTTYTKVKNIQEMIEINEEKIYSDE